MEGSFYSREAVRAIVKGIRETHNLSLRDYGEITGLGRDYVSALLFAKGDRMSEETAWKLLSPFAFGDYYPKVERLSLKDANAVRWANPQGYQDRSEVRQELLDFKKELGASWTELADYFDMPRSVISRMWQKHDWIADSEADRWRREMRKIRSLPQSRKDQLFGKPQKSTTYVDSVKLRMLLHDIKVRFSYKTWDELAKDLSEVSETPISRDTLYDIRRGRKMREGNYQNKLDACSKLLQERSRRQSLTEAAIEKVAEGSSTVISIRERNRRSRVARNDKAE